MTEQERLYLVSALQSGEDLSPDWADVIWPAGKRESEKASWFITARSAKAKSYPTR
jgi:hypothetical protein